MSAGYYDRHADQFFAETVGADMTDLRTRFLRHVSASGRVLDAGCGSGRDALAFRQAGYVVTAFDASAEMVRRARQHTGLPVLRMTFDDIAWVEAFDGIWASASLLHVPRTQLLGVFKAMENALCVHGVLYASLKHGSEERHVGGRVFTDLTGEEIRRMLEDAGLVVIEIWLSPDVRAGRSGEMWVNALARKTTPG